MNDFSRKTLSSLSRKGITVIGLAAIPNASSPMPYANATRGYRVNDNGCGRVWTFAQVLEAAPMSAVLDWRSLPYEHSKFLVVGTEIAAAYVPGTHCRFAVVETRGRPVNGRAGDVYYVVRDAATVGDDDVRRGKRVAVVARFETPDEAVTWCLERMGACEAPSISV